MKMLFNTAPCEASEQAGAPHLSPEYLQLLPPTDLPRPHTHRPHLDGEDRNRRTKDKFNKHIRALKEKSRKMETKTERGGTV